MVHQYCNKGLSTCFYELPTLEFQWPATSIVGSKSPTGRWLAAGGGALSAGQRLMMVDPQV